MGFIIAHNEGALKETQSTYFMLLTVTQCEQENVENDDNSVEKSNAALPIEENSVRLRTQLEGHWQLWGAVKTGQFGGQVGVILTNLGSIWVVLT